MTYFHFNLEVEVIIFKFYNYITKFLPTINFSIPVTCGNCGRLSDTIENTNTWPIDVKVIYFI